MLNKMKCVTRREALLAMGVGALAACVSDRPTEPDGEEGTIVDMTDQLTFDPVSVTIRAGETVTFKNSSAFAHTATGDPSKANDPSHVRLPAGAAAWDSGAIGAGGQFNQRFDVVGEYRYFCIPHESQGMLGTVTVTA